MTTAHEPTVAVCVLFYERPEQTIECVLSIAPSGTPLYVLDNGSSPAARSRLADACASYPNIRILDSSANVGVGPGRNRLIASTSESWLLFLDSDIVVHTVDWKDRIIRHITASPDTEVFIPKLFNKHEDKLVKYHRLSLLGQRALLTETDSADTNIFPGGASFVSRRLFDRLGHYDDGIFVGGEDFELCLRGILSQSPVRARLVDDILLVHDHRRPVHHADIRSVRSRYDVTTIARSYERIRQKHGIILDDGWQPWVRRQAHSLLSRESPLAKAKKAVGRLRQRLSRRPHLKTPTTCTLYMTARCNLDCTACRRSVLGITPAPDMTLAVLDRTMSLYPDIKSFCIAGFGEPTLCPAFPDIVDLLKCRNRYVGVITNGVEVDNFFRLGTAPDYISISLYGCDNASYASHCGLPAFDRVIRNYRLLRRRFGNVGFSFIVTKHNLDILRELLTHLDRLEPSFLHLVNYLAYDVSNPEEIRRIITTADTDLIERIDALAAPRSYIRLKPIYIDPRRPSYNCRSYCNLLNVDGNGNIGGCQRQNPPDRRYGNIFVDKDPFNSPQMVSLRTSVENGEHAHEQCRYCFGSWA